MGKQTTKSKLDGAKLDVVFSTCSASKGWCPAPVNGLDFQLLVITKLPKRKKGKRETRQMDGWKQVDQPRLCILNLDTCSSLLPTSPLSTGIRS